MVSMLPLLIVWLYSCYRYSSNNNVLSVDGVHVLEENFTKPWREVTSKQTDGDFCGPADQWPRPQSWPFKLNYLSVYLLNARTSHCILDEGSLQVGSPQGMPSCTNKQLCGLRESSVHHFWTLKQCCNNVCDVVPTSQIESAVLIVLALSYIGSESVTIPHFVYWWI